MVHQPDELSGHASCYGAPLHRVGEHEHDIRQGEHASHDEALKQQLDFSTTILGCGETLDMFSALMNPDQRENVENHFDSSSAQGHGAVDPMPYVSHTALQIEAPSEELGIKHERGWIVDDDTIEAKYRPRCPGECVKDCHGSLPRKKGTSFL